MRLKDEACFALINRKRRCEKNESLPIKAERRGPTLGAGFLSCGAEAILYSVFSELKEKESAPKRGLDFNNNHTVG